jgi:hypothetical protein
MTPVSADQNTAAAAAQAALVRFFAAPNAFLHSLGTPAAQQAEKRIVPPALTQAIARFAKGYSDRPFLLPFASQAGSRVCWFACAHDELGARALLDEMVAFIGPSFGEFEVSGALLSPVEESAKGLLCQAGLHVIAFFAITVQYEQRIVQRWQVYWQLLDQRPPRVRQELRTFHQLRAAFDRALIARNEKEAMAAMAALCHQHGLSAENRVFLEIRMHAAFGRWDSILSHPQWDDILKVRLPPETYGDIWDALYETHLAKIEEEGSADQLIKTFAEKLRITAASLLKGRGRSRRPSALKGFLLHELSLGTPSAQLCAALLTELGTQAFGPASAAVTALANALQPKAGFEQAIKEMELERYEQAFALLLPLSDSVEVLLAQLRCAKEIDHPGHAREALARLSSTATEIETKVRGTRARLIADVEKLAAEDVVAPIKEQLQILHTPASADDIVVYWREMARSPDGRALLEQPSFVQSLLSTVEDYAVEQSPLFESLFPIWFDWLVVQTAPTGSLVKVYQGFVEALYARDRLGDTEREMIKLATRHCLLAGLTPTEYTRLVDRLGDVLPDSPSPREIGWALDLADLLVVQPCRDDEARLRWTTRVVNSATNCFSRLSGAERALLQLLARETNIALPSFPADQDDEGEQVRIDVEARIFLYSLDTQAIQRAAVVLAAMFPNAKIDTNSDETCTARLKTGVRHADWVVFVAGVATHQAFYCIKAALRSEAALLQVEGTGTTRIVERVMRQIYLAPAVAA